MKEVWAQCRHKSASESVDFLFDRLLAFSGERISHDDITAVVLKVLS
jgi:serine phosphatase RsbU (regulator of sigma subunit)